MLSSTHSYFGFLVKVLREHASLSKAEFIFTLDLSCSYSLLSNIENGNAQLSIDDFLKISSFFNLNLDKVFNFIKLCQHLNSFSPPHNLKDLFI